MPTSAEAPAPSQRATPRICATMLGENSIGSAIPITTANPSRPRPKLRSGEALSAFAAQSVRVGKSLADRPSVGRA